MKKYKVTISTYLHGEVLETETITISAFDKPKVGWTTSKSDSISKKITKVEAA